MSELYDYGEGAIDVTKLKYVLYARKSTDDPKRQVRSITDQISDCKELAERYNLRVIRVLKEERSAKKPQQRPVFAQMIKDIKAGNYDAILAWHPDRLARNMREGGALIDLVDEEIIKDLKFVAYHFSPDPSGKMLLGMAFVLSKEYSDRLSMVVTRGVRKQLAEGHTPTPKYGYRNEGGVYQPDGKNFELIVDAWQMRKKNTSLDDIAAYLNGRGFYRQAKTTKAKYTVDGKKLSNIFRDSFYYGILVQAGQNVDLRQLYDFQQAVSEEDFFYVQRHGRVSHFHTKTAKGFYPFKGILSCAFCGRHMVVAPSTSGGGKRERLLYCRCDNKECKAKKLRKKRSCRIKHVLKFIYDFLEGGLNLTQQDYERYYTGLKRLSDQQLQEVRQELHSTEGVRKRVDAEITERSLKILDIEKGTMVYQRNEQKIEELTVELRELERAIAALKEKLAAPERLQLSLKDFLNLSKNAATKVKAADAVGKDALCRLIFLNLAVGDDEVVSYKLREPFKTLLKNKEMQKGNGSRGDRI